MPLQPSTIYSCPFPGNRVRVKSSGSPGGCQMPGPGFIRLYDTDVLIPFCQGNSIYSSLSIRPSYGARGEEILDGGGGRRAF